MAKWLNHVTIANPGTGSTTETDRSDAGTVIAGTLFTPAAGRLLVAVVDGSVTSTTPVGWALSDGSEAVSNTGLYVFWRVATGTVADRITTTHNGDGTWPTAISWFEFPAGSTFVASAPKVSVGNAGDGGPTLSGLTGTNLILAVAAQGSSGQPSGSAWTWSPGVELIDYVNSTATKGFALGIAYLEDSVLTSAQFTATIAGGTTLERLVFAVNVPASGPYIGRADTSFNVGVVTSKTTGTSLTVAVGDVLVCIAVNAGDSAQGTFSTPTNSGTAFTWTLRQSVVVSAYQLISVWTAVATAAQTMTVQVGRSGASGAFWGVSVSQWRGSSGVGASAKANTASGAPTLALTTGGATSGIAFAVVSWDAEDGSARAWRSVNGSAATEDIYFRDAAQYGVYLGHHVDAGAAGSKSVGLTAPTMGKHSILAVEILGSAAPGPLSYNTGFFIAG